MFSCNTKNYLYDTMQLDVGWLINELSLWEDEVREVTVNFIEVAVLHLKQDNDLENIDVFYRENLKKTSFEKYEPKLTEVWVIFRHFSGLTSPGFKHSVLQLFKAQQAEGWHPKMNIRKILTPNDIDLLADDIQVFRGSDLSEYNSGQYGQSWTFSKKIADRFAYEHYQTYDWFDYKQRLVMSASIPKSAIFYYKASDSEDEVIVDTKYLTNVVKIS